MRYIHLAPYKLENETVTLDHSVQAFAVVIRSMTAVHPQTLKDLIQKRYEVISLMETDRTDYVL